MYSATASSPRPARRYSNSELCDNVRACGEELGKAPTMRDYAAWHGRVVHPQTLIKRFRTWNTVIREAGFKANRYMEREEMLRALRELGAALGRTPSAKDLRLRAELPSRSLYAQIFGSFGAALREAGFSVAIGMDERRKQALRQGLFMSRRLGHLPTFGEWREARMADTNLTSEWQIYRLYESEQHGAWRTFCHELQAELEQRGIQFS